MSSGASFLFVNQSRQYILKRFKKMLKKINTQSLSAKRFISFFRLNRMYGADVQLR